MRSTLGALVFLAAAACGGTTPGTSDDTGDDGDDVGDDTPVEPDAADPVDTAVRFVAIGDAGKGNEGQQQVADAIAAHCAAEGCDFVVLLGDNIYDDGPVSATDDQWNAKFEVPYAAIDLPFYAVLGNHDYGGELIIDVPGLGNEWDKADYSVERTQMSTKWKMPSTHYTFEEGNTGFIALDTNAILWSNEEHGDVVAWYPTALAAVSARDWKIAFGHHPHRSNGTHGNAGAYDAPELLGIEVPNPLPIQNGADMKTFYDDHLCGTVDVLITGHDHSRQWLDESDLCAGTEMIVSGSGASVTDLPTTNNVTFYQDATKVGFLYVVIDGNTFTGQFYDKDLNLDFERQLVH